MDLTDMDFTSQLVERQSEEIEEEDTYRLRTVQETLFIEVPFRTWRWSNDWQLGDDGRVSVVSRVSKSLVKTAASCVRIDGVEWEMAWWTKEMCEQNHVCLRGQAWMPFEELSPKTPATLKLKPALVQH